MTPLCFRSATLSRNAFQRLESGNAFDHFSLRLAIRLSSYTTKEVVVGMEFSAQAHDSYPTFSFVMMKPAAPLRL
jgi:hypothetical protein